MLVIISLQRVDGDDDDDDEADDDDPVPGSSGGNVYPTTVSNNMVLSTPGPDTSLGNNGNADSSVGPVIPATGKSSTIF